MKPAETATAAKDVSVPSEPPASDATSAPVATTSASDSTTTTATTAPPSSLPASMASLFSELDDDLLAEQLPDLDNLVSSTRTSSSSSAVNGAPGHSPPP